MKSGKYQAGGAQSGQWHQMNGTDQQRFAHDQVRFFHQKRKRVRLGEGCLDLAPQGQDALAQFDLLGEFLHSLLPGMENLRRQIRGLVLQPVSQFFRTEYRGRAVYKMKKTFWPKDIQVRAVRMIQIEKTLSVSIVRINIIQGLDLYLIESTDELDEVSLANKKLMNYRWYSKQQDRGAQEKNIFLK